VLAQRREATPAEALAQADAFLAEAGRTTPAPSCRI